MECSKIPLRSQRSWLGDCFAEFGGFIGLRSVRNNIITHIIHSVGLDFFKSDCLNARTNLKYD